MVKMEESITKMGKNLANFCNNLQSTTSSFKQSLERRPIPLDSASSTFIQTLNRRVASLTGDLNLLESMSLGAVSFEELLGHCNQLYKLNHSQLVHLHSHLLSLSYIPPSDGIDDLEEDFMGQSSCSTPEPESQLNTSHYRSITNNMDNSSIFEESPSFQKLGLSDISLATLASGGVCKHDVPDSPPSIFHRFKVPNQETLNIHNTFGAKEIDEPDSSEMSALILVSNEDYESLPSYMKSVASWKDLQSAVDRMNSFLSKKGNKEQSNFFHPQELESMGFGSKGRSYVLLLVRMKRLKVETNNGLISYRVL
ncbi:putative ribulose bisphosphate carboxylase-like protein [Bienertia sinuspersici]